SHLILGDLELVEELALHLRRVNEHVIHDAVQESQREPMDQPGLPAVACLVIDVVRREDQLLAKEFEVDVQQGALDPRKLAEPKDMEQFGIRTGREYHEAAVVSQHAPHFPDQRVWVLAPHEVVELQVAGPGNLTIGKLIVPDTGDMYAPRQ